MNRAQLPDEVFGIPQERKYPMPGIRFLRLNYLITSKINMKNNWRKLLLKI